MKKHLLKSFVCGLMLATVAGSAVYAGTNSLEEYGYNKENITKTFYGDAGWYKTEAKNGGVAITAKSTSQSYKLYKADVTRKHVISGEIGDFDANSATLKSGGTVAAGIVRDSVDASSKYVNTSIAYNSSSEITGIQDKYVYTIIQNN